MDQQSRTFKVLVLSFGQTLISLSSIFSSMVAARMLTKLDYATFKQTLLAYQFAAPLLMLGLPNAVYYFLPKENVNKRGVIIDNLVLIGISACLFSLFLALGGSDSLSRRFNNPNLSETLSWMIYYPLYVMPSAIIGAVLLTQNKTNLLVLYNIVISVLLTVSVMIAVYMTKGYALPLKIQIFLPLLFFPFGMYLCFKNTSGVFRYPIFSNLKNMLSYAIPLGLAGTMSMLMLETNKVVVSWMGTPEEFANYINGAVEIPLIGIVTGSIASVILVDMTKLIDEGNKKEALKLFHTAAVRSAAILFPVTIFLMIAAKPFIITLFSEKYIESIVPFCIYLLVMPIRIVVYGSALMALGFSKIILYRSIGDLLINTILSIIFVYFMGYLGAAIATVVTLYIWTVPYNLIKIGNGFNVRFWETLPLSDLRRIFLICCFTSPLGFTHILFGDPQWVLKLVVSAFLYFIVTGYFLYRSKFLLIPVKFNKFIPSRIRIEH